MNTGTVTGGVVKAATPAYTPKGEKRVQFVIAIRDSKGVDAFWNCEAEGDPVMLAILEAEAQPGRGIKIDYELATRPYVQHGVHKGELRFLRVIRAEVAPPRVKREAEEPAEVESGA